MSARPGRAPGARSDGRQAAGHAPDEEGLPTPLSRAAGEFLNYLRVERGLSENTVKAYRRTLVRYLMYLEASGIDEPGDITRESVAGFAVELSAPRSGALSSRSLAQAFSSVRTFHKLMVTEGYREGDPSTVLLSPKMPVRLPRALSREQVDRLLDTPPGGDDRGVRDRMILELLYATGMRISELVGLDLGDVDLAERLVTCHGKGGKWRMVPFGREAAGVLDEYVTEVRPRLSKMRAPRALVLNMRGERLTRQGCWKIIKGRAREAGLEDVVTPHGLRHTFATHLLEGGANLLVVKELLGHSSIATTQIYTEVTREHLKKVYASTHPRA